MTQHNPIRVQLLPHERVAIHKWNATPDIQVKLQGLAPDVDVLKLALPYALQFLAQKD